MPSSRTIILLGGLPASGKSTLASRIQNHYKSDDAISCIHLEYDALEDEIASIQQGIESEATKSKDSEESTIAAWNEARKAAVANMEETLKTHEKEESSTSLIVLMDDNYHLRGMRKQIHRLLLNHYHSADRPLNFGILWMETDVETCLQRNESRTRQVPKHVITKMKDSLEKPRANWEAYFLSISEETQLDQVLVFVNNCQQIQELPQDLVDPEQQERDRLQTSENQRHNWDKLLRSWVGVVAKHDKSLAPGANAGRKEVLMEMKAPTCDIYSEEDLLDRYIHSIVESTGRDTIHQELKNILQQ